MRALRGQASMGERVTFGCLLTVHADLYNPRTEDYYIQNVNLRKLPFTSY